MKKTLAFMLTVLICLIVVLPNFVLATQQGQVNPNEYKEIYNDKNSNNKVLTAGGKILGIIRVVAVSAGVICLIILGAKYMIMSSNADNKATIKEKLIPYFIGAVLLFGGSGILTIIQKVTQEVAKNIQVS